MHVFTSARQSSMVYFGALLFCMALVCFTYSGHTFANSTQCQVVSSVPTVINKSGVYCLSRDLAYRASSGVAIEIKKHNVVLDLRGFRVFGTAALGNETVGVKVANRHKVRITNGTIERFRVGIELDRGVANSIDNMLLDQNRQFGIYQSANGKSLKIVDNSITRTGGTTSALTFPVIGKTNAAILVGDRINLNIFGVRLQGNTLFDIRESDPAFIGPYGILAFSENGSYKDNVVSGRDLGGGMSIAGANNVVYENSVANENGDGIGIFAGAPSNIYANNSAMNFRIDFDGGTDGGGNVSTP